MEPLWQRSARRTKQPKHENVQLRRQFEILVGGIDENSQPKERQTLLLQQQMDHMSDALNILESNKPTLLKSGKN